MKKHIIATLLLSILLLSITPSAFAFTLNISFSDGYLSIFDIMTLGAIGLFLLGMLFILLALFAGKNEKKAAPHPAPQTNHATPAAAPAETSSNIIEMEETEETAEEAQLSDSSESEENNEIETPESNSSTDQADDQNAPTEASATEPEAPSDDAEASEEPPESAVSSEKALEKTCDVTLTGINTKDVFTFSLTNGETYTVGRKKENHICLPDSIVSGKHCTFVFEDDRLYLRDEHSTNGTKVNGRKIAEPRALHTGDVIAIGRREYRIGI